ncbi:MAG: rhodanese-related sulfurtransferase [Saprospiraceae bacterium]|nr:rhodanese-related sulfurtransferase [Saprospiraceae bacterium]
MPRLYNIFNGEELKARLQQSTEARTTLSFYQYWNIEDPQRFRDDLYLRWSQLGVMGRIYVAKEGINGQISVPTANFEAFKKDIYAIPFLEGIRLNIAVDDNGKSFFKLKIKVRDKIVADGLDDASFDVTKRGKHLRAAEFNRLTDDPDTIVIDMRNHYESEVGYYENAIRPDVETFREALPIVEALLEPNKDANIVMYCTGGIRCEKASAYYLHRGFKNVFMVDGGIIEYTRQCQELGLPNKFIGKNFVFDERMGERISPEVVAHCHQCGAPCDTHVNCANDACHILFIQCPACAEKYKHCCSQLCSDFNQLPEEERHELRKTRVFNGTHFSKGRYKAFRQGEGLVLG